MQFSYKFLAGKSVFHEEKKLFLSDVSIRNHLANWSSFYFRIWSSNPKKYYYKLLWFEVFFSNLVYHNFFQIHHEKFEHKWKKTCYNGRSRRNDQSCWWWRWIARLWRICQFDSKTLKKTQKLYSVFKILKLYLYHVTFYCRRQHHKKNQTLYDHEKTKSKIRIKTICTHWFFWFTFSFQQKNTPFVDRKLCM